MTQTSTTAVWKDCRALGSSGADGSHVFVAVRKALVPLGFRMPGADARRAVDQGPTLTALITPSMFVRFVSFPLTSNGQIVGAIATAPGTTSVALRRAGG